MIDLTQVLYAQRAIPRGDELLTHFADNTTCLRAIAIAVPLIAKIFGKTEDQVLDDLCWMLIQAEFDRIHRAAGVDPASLPSGRRAQA